MSVAVYKINTGLLQGHSEGARHIHTNTHAHHKIIRIEQLVLHHLQMIQVFSDIIKKTNSGFSAEKERMLNLLRRNRNV